MEQALPQHNKTVSESSPIWHLGKPNTNPTSRTNSLVLPPPPWDPWEFDPKFFQTLARWDQDHPESTFQHIYNKINTAVETVQPLFELIPDSPFPARGLVKALAHLVTLGWVSRPHPSLPYLT
jgi:hypothetical protein